MIPSMTDAYDELRKDWCDVGDLPRATCWHCGARPGGNVLPPLERPWTFDGQAAHRRTGRNVFPSIDTPAAEPVAPRKLARKVTPGECACGEPTRDDAYGCDTCAGELERIFAEAPWLAEQLDATVTKQRAAGGASTGGATRLTCSHDDPNLCSCPVTLPWNDKAATILAALRKHLAATVKVCHAERIRHQSPYAGDPNTDSIPSMSLWLLWRVDGLTLSRSFGDILRNSIVLEADALKAIDRGPDLMYLGLCDARDEDGLCGGAIYARAGDDTGKCRACRATYDVDARRGGLEKALDDRLCTASEIAHLTTYLGLPIDRQRVRNIVNQWHRRGRITAAPGPGEPRFRYGDIAPLLAVAYADDKSKGA